MILLAKNGAFPTTIDVKAAYRYYQTGLSLKAVGNIFGRDQTAIENIFKRRGLHVRTHKESHPIRHRTGKAWMIRDYAYIYDPEGFPSERDGTKKCVAVHAVIGKELLGRVLTRDECVHHLDLDKRNNDRENLCVMTRRNHRRLHAVLGEVGIRLLVAGQFEQVRPHVPKDFWPIVKRIYILGERVVLGGALS